MAIKPGYLKCTINREDFAHHGNERDIQSTACIHWLVGSSPESNMHEYWEEVGIAQGRKFINMDEYMHFESPDGRILTFYTDVDRLEKQFLEFSPQDDRDNQGIH